MNNNTRSYTSENVYVIQQASVIIPNKSKQVQWGNNIEHHHHHHHQYRITASNAAYRLLTAPGSQHISPQIPRRQGTNEHTNLHKLKLRPSIQLKTGGVVQWARCVGLHYRLAWGSRKWENDTLYFYALYTIVKQQIATQI